MKYKIHGMLVAVPVKFPEEVALRLFPHCRETGLEYGVSYEYADRRSWASVRRWVPLQSFDYERHEELLERGENVALVLGDFDMELPDDVTGPGLDRPYA